MCWGAVPAPQAPVVGCRLQGREQRQGLGGEGFRMERGARRTSAQTCSRGGADEVGGGISQGRQEGRLARALASPRISHLAAPLGSGALLCLDRPQPQDEQGLREVMCVQRSVRICWHDSPHAEAIDSPLRPFHTVSEGEFSEVRVATALHFLPIFY